MYYITTHGGWGVKESVGCLVLWPSSSLTRNSQNKSLYVSLTTHSARTGKNHKKTPLLDIGSFSGGYYFLFFFFFGLPYHFGLYLVLLPRSLFAAISKLGTPPTILKYFPLLIIKLHPVQVNNFCSISRAPQRGHLYPFSNSQFGSFWSLFIVVFRFG